MIQEPPIQSYYEQVETISSNQLTLSSYELGIQEYINGTDANVSGNFKIWIDHILTFLPPNARVIEVGSGFGRDAKYIESFGFEVERTDATLSFVNLLQGQGYSAHEFNILTDAFSTQYDLVFANAVFLHFTPQELEKTFEKIHTALNKNGVLAFSVKRGEGEEWTTAKLERPRYFCYWTVTALCQKLESARFEILSILEDEKFIQVIAKPLST